MNFYTQCAEFLNDLAEKIEKLDTKSNLEIEYLDGILKIVINVNKKTFVVNRNAGNFKIWYSSPYSGADYFSIDESSKNWLNAQGVELSTKLLNELKTHLS